MVWTKLDAVGTPLPRYGHSANVLQMSDGGCITVLFGGVIAGERTNDVLVLHNGNGLPGLRCAPPLVGRFTTRLPLPPAV